MYKDLSILSLDQSTTKTGWAYFLEDDFVTSGILTTNDGMNGMMDNILKLVNELKPTYIIFEDIYLNQDPKFKKIGVQEFKKLAQLQGYIRGICHIQDLGYYIIPPTEWKSHYKFKGKREEQKRASIDYVKTNYKLDASDDETDAILLGQYILDIRE